MLNPGTHIGRYEVVRKLAEGGMAEIYLAHAVGPEGFSKEVVIKMVRSFLASDPQFVQMFIAEARLASRLNHANVVQIFDFGKHDDTYYLAMEYVRGASLWDLRQRCRRDGVPFPPVLAAELASQVARGLHYAHTLTDHGQRLGVVHRDVTPHNVLLSFDGAVKLTDFGIAKATTTHTAPGMLKGKFAYMSPEQARGQPVDARTDVFALGIVLWEMLTGGRLFDGDSELAVLRAVEGSVIAPPARLNPDVPPELSDIVTKALARPPPERFQSAFEFERALATFVLRSAQAMEDTSIGLFLQQLFREELEAQEAAYEAPAGGLPADGFARSDTLAVDRSGALHGGRVQPTMTMTPAAREVPRAATPNPRTVLKEADPLGTLKMGDVGAALGARTATLDAVEPSMDEPPPRQNTEQYRPASRRLAPLVGTSGGSQKPTTAVAPAIVPAAPVAQAPIALANVVLRPEPVDAPAPPVDEEPLVVPRSRAIWVAAGAALVLLVAGGVFLALGGDTQPTLPADTAEAVTATPETSPPAEAAKAHDAAPEAVAPQDTAVAAVTPPARDEGTPRTDAPPNDVANDAPANDAPKDGAQAHTGDAPSGEATGEGAQATATATDDDEADDAAPATATPRQPKVKAATASKKPEATVKGTLSVRAVPYASVYAGASLLGNEVQGTRAFQLPAGTHIITFVHPNKRERRKVLIKANETSTVVFDATQ